ncbi:MHYT domain-containing protein [Phenylobacterium sp.]|jgi:NO-binding membrane sensor protein with MHYT domain/two-component sensor histidine kinase|uniref:MHYT domain-containing protein n=1 Tax=Phenylobacterium sp. TaxID=1871053 RepID=UPI002F42B65F
MHHSQHPLFVVLSLVVAVLGSWTALDLFRRVRSHIGRTRAFWLGTAAVAMGLSIWSMHFVAMLGFEPGGPVAYDPSLTALSLILAMAATWGAFFWAARSAQRFRTLIAGVAMGVGICLMHYVGMAALRIDAQLSYVPAFVVASFAVAIGASTAALFAARREHTLAWRAVAALVLGLAICGMHYTAMAGLRLAPTQGASMGPPGAPPFALGVSVATGATVILLLALLASLYDQRLNVMAALDAGGVGYWELVLPQMEFHISPRARTIFGLDPEGAASHDDILAALAPEDRARREDVFRAALDGTADYDAEYRLAADPSRWVNIRGRVVAWRRGRPWRLSGVMLDVSDRRRAFDALEESQRRQRLLIDELNHRVKNTLATVQSIARQSAKDAASMAAFRAAFEARLVALSETHNALTRGGWSGASLRELLVQEFAPYAPAQVRLDGDDLSLPPRLAVALGMVFHELATNAAKYGALSTADGLVSVSWRSDGLWLAFSWAESGGPAVRAPTRRGFGSQLVEGTFARELGGSAELVYDPAGFRAELRAPQSFDPPAEPPLRAAS